MANNMINNLFGMADKMTQKQAEARNKANKIRFAQWLTEMCYKYEKQPHGVVNDFVEAVEVIEARLKK